MKKVKKGIEISHWKVGDANGFQAMDPGVTGEEPEIADCFNIEEEGQDDIQKQKEGNNKKGYSKSR
jgi:hypothetical protein